MTPSSGPMSVGDNSGLDNYSPVGLSTIVEICWVLD